MTAERDWFLDACAIAAEHAPGPGRWRKCFRCNGDGELRHPGYSLSKHSGVMARDPQLEVSEECPDCENGWVQITNWEKAV